MRRSRSLQLGSAFLLALALAPGRIGAQDGSVRVLEYNIMPPAGWQSRTPSSRMRVAEWVIPGKGGAQGAEAVLYYFGIGQGGSVEANLQRWRGQFSNPAGGAVPEKLRRDTAGEFPITIAEWEGTYARGIGPGGDPRPGQALVAAIAETPRGTLFFQLFGPVASVKPQVAAYLAMVRGIK